MQTARHLVAVVVELAAGVEDGQHDFRRRLAARMLIDGDAAAVVDDRDRPVDVNRHVDLIAETGKGLVDRVVDDLVDEVVQARRSGRADVHGGPLADRLEAFEDPDLVRGILRHVCGRAVPVVAGGHVGRLRLLWLCRLISVCSFHVFLCSAARPPRATACRLARAAGAFRRR